MQLIAAMRPFMISVTTSPIAPAHQSDWELSEIAVYQGHQTKDGTSAIAKTVRDTLPSRKQPKERVQFLLG